MLKKEVRKWQMRICYEKEEKGVWREKMNHSIHFFKILIEKYPFPTQEFQCCAGRHVQAFTLDLKSLIGSS